MTHLILPISGLHIRVGHSANRSLRVWLPPGERATDPIRGDDPILLVRSSFSNGRNLRRGRSSSWTVVVGAIPSGDTDVAVQFRTGKLRPTRRGTVVPATRLDDRYWVAEGPSWYVQVRVYFDRRLVANLDNEPHLRAGSTGVGWLHVFSHSAGRFLGEPPPSVTSWPGRSKISRL